MSEIAPAAATAEEVPLPHWVPALLSFVAGYVDVYTFLVLFGLFVAQVTGSFVTAGAELVTHDVGITGKAIAILAFLFAACLDGGADRAGARAESRGPAVDARFRNAASCRLHCLDARHRSGHRRR